MTTDLFSAENGARRLDPPRYLDLIETALAKWCLRDEAPVFWAVVAHLYVQEIQQADWPVQILVAPVNWLEEVDEALIEMETYCPELWTVPLGIAHSIVQSILQGQLPVEMLMQPAVMMDDPDDL